MATYKKDQITFLFICFNEASTLPTVFDILKEGGFSKFVVMDDHSSDDTGKIAKQSGATVVRNRTVLGFKDTLLKGLFLVDSPGVVVIADPYVRISQELLQRFVEFGVIGEYPLLISRGRKQRGINFSKILRKKYGIYLDEPDFQAVFLNKRMQAVVKKRVTGNGPYVFFELVKAAISEDLKIGVRDAGIYERAYKPPWYMWLRRRKRIKYEKQQRQDYIKTAFPGLRLQQALDKVAIGVMSGIIVVALTPLIVWGIGKLGAWVGTLWK